MTSHNTNGGIIPHIARRCIHSAMLSVPLLYYHFLYLFTQKTWHLAIIIFIFFVFLFEKLRIRYRLVFFAQRAYEATQISAFAWTILSLGILLLLSPAASYAIAIVATCAFVDPLMGELRLLKINTVWVIFAGILMGIIIWAMCAWIYHIPFWFALLMPPIAVAAEWPMIKWIDDNAMMLLVPLAVVMLIS